MPYLVQYQYTYSQKTGSTAQLVQVTLFKKSSLGSGTPVITELVASSNPFRVSIIDNDKNKYTTIRGKQANLIFKPQEGITASTFSTGADDEWIVEAVVVGTGFTLFKGFLVMDDHQQSFLPVSHAYDIELVATDNLGTLKEVPLTDDSGAYMRGKKKLIEVIAQCLKKTNLQLDIVVTDTWMEQSQTGFMTALNFVSPDMKMFENKTGEAISCYDALVSISSFWLSIKQYNGQWWIENVNDKKGSSIYRFRFDYTGTFIEQQTTTTFNKTIGRTQALKLINKDAVVTFTRPIKSGKLSVDYRLPNEIPDNTNFDRGTFISPLSPDSIVNLETHANRAAFPGTGNAYTTYKATDTGLYWKWNGTTYELTYNSPYTADDWTVINTGRATTTTFYTVKKYKDSNLTYLDERYLRVLPATSSASPWDHVRSNAIPITQRDKAIVSVDFRYETPDTRNAATGRFIFTFYIQKGTGYYFYNQTNNSWQGPLSITNANFGVLQRWDSTNFDETNWQTVSVELPPFPVNGNLFIGLFNGKNFDTTSPILNYSNFQFNYIPYIYGDYSKITGHYNKIEQSGNYKATIDEQVYLGDSPKPLFKHSMFKFIGGEYVLTEGWFNGAELLEAGIAPPYPPSADHLHPFGWIQIQGLWNQYKRRMIGLSGTVKGLDMTTTNVADLIHAYKVDAVTIEVDYTKKWFVLVGLEHGYEKEQWTATLEETADDDVPRDYSTPVQFKYEGGEA